MRVSVRNMCGLLVAIVIGGGFFSTVSADRYSSTHYVIDASVVGNSFGGSQSSTSYKLTSSGGESIVGNGQGGSYKVGMGYVAQLDKSLTLSLQPSGLIAAYSLDEPAGSRFADSGVNANDGKLVGAPARVAGKIGNALGPFDAVNYAEVIPTSPFDNLSALTACAWVKMIATSSNPFFLSRSYGSPTQDGMWAIGFNAGTTPKAYIYGNSIMNTIDSSLGTIGLGSWHQACITYDGSTFAFYIDATLAGSMPLTISLGTPSAPVRIGCRATGSNPFDGLVDQVKIFGRALTNDEIRAEYDAQDVGYDSGLSLGTIVPNISNNVLSDVVVQTDASSYTLAINQNNDLTSGSYTIPAISSGTIASPVAWNEGTTKGLGFSLSATNASALPGSWGSGANYAAFPGTATTFYTRTGVPTTKDYVTLKIRADVSTTQASTTTPYSNIVTVTGTITP